MIFAEIASFLLPCECSKDPSNSPMSREDLPHDLLVDQLFQLLLGEVILVFVEIKEFLWNRRSCWLIFGIVIWLEIWVLQGLVDGDTLDWVESEKFLKEVES